MVASVEALVLRPYRGPTGSIAAESCALWDCPGPGSRAGAVLSRFTASPFFPGNSSSHAGERHFITWFFIGPTRAFSPATPMKVILKTFILYLPRKSPEIFMRLQFQLCKGEKRITSAVPRRRSANSMMCAATFSMSAASSVS